MSRFVSIVVLVAAGLGVTSRASLAQEAGEPLVTLGQSVVEYGDQLQVRGTGFTPGSLIHIELCGNAALEATADCDVRGATEYAARPSGELFGLITVRPLPQPCPCVVRLTSGTEALELIEPVEVPQAGFTTASQRIPDAVVASSLRVTALEVHGSGGLAGLLGGAQERTVRLELLNSGEASLRDPAIALTYGRGDDPTGLLEVPAVADIPPGERVDIVVPLRLDAFALGRYTVRASVSGVGDPVVARAGVATYPWALISLGLAAVQLALLRVRDRLRRRIARQIGASGGPPSPPSAAATDVGARALPSGPPHAVADPGSLALSVAVPPYDGQSTALVLTARSDELVAELEHVVEVLRTSGSTGRIPMSAPDTLMRSVPPATALLRDELLMARARGDSVGRALEQRIEEVQSGAEGQLAEVEARIVRAVGEADAAAEGILMRIEDARLRADELASQAVREVAAARADLTEAALVEAEAIEGTRWEVRELARRLREDANRVLLDCRNEADERVAELERNEQAILAGAELRSSADSGSSEVVPSIVDLRVVRGSAPDEADAVPDPARHGDALANAIQRAVRRSLAQ